jgi:nucleotide-binding universal stress UspA family protein
MSLKHLLVHVDSSARAQHRLDLAITLAHRFGATLTGVFSESPILGSALVGVRTRDNVAKARAEARASFESKADAAGVSRTWLQIEGSEFGEILGWTVVSCRYADLGIFAQHGEEGSRLPDDLVEQVLLGSGRPVLVVPYIGQYLDVGKRVLVAWTGSRDSARALNDAMPFLERAQEVRVISFQLPSDGTTGGPAPQLDVIAHLHAHGIEARYERMMVDDFGVANHLLNRASDWSADLTVVGGYSVGGFPFLTRSNTTRELLRSMTTPVLLSH